MHTLILQPQNYTSIFKNSWHLYRKSFLRIIILSILIAAITISPTIYFPKLSSDDFALVYHGAIAFLPYFPLFLVFILWFHIAMVSTLNSIIMAEQRSVLQSIFKALSQLPVVYVVTIAYFISVFVGWVFFIIPGLFLMFSLILFFPLLILRDANITNVFKKSYHLVYGHWWKTFCVMIVLYLVYFLFVYLNDLLTRTYLEFEFKGNISAIFITHVCLHFVISLFFIPWFYCVFLTLYHDLKLRAEEKGIK